ncbi:MAG: glycosyltransferase family 4 protein [Candidatus Limnocylindria bacterium]
MPGRRVAVVVHASFPADPRIRRQADALLAAGYEVDVFALREPGEPAEERLGALRIVRLPVRRRFVGFAGHLAEYLAFTGLAAVRLTREHRQRGYALVQVATLPDFLVASAAVLKLAGVPLLLDLHEDMPAFFNDRFASGPLRPMRPVMRGVARASAAMADAVITVHEPLRQLSLARGIAPDKISVVMNSADDRIFDPARHPRRGFMEDGELRLIHHSSLQRIYGLEIAVWAVAEIGDRIALRLDVYGDGPYRPQVEATIAALGAGDRVQLHGRVAIDELPRLLAASDLALVPSLPEPYLELSLSTKLLEAVAMGVPVIASDLATFRAHFTPDAMRYVTGGDSVLLAAAIVELADDPERAAGIAREARREAEPYAWPIQAKGYLEVVDRLVGRRTAR